MEVPLFLIWLTIFMSLQSSSSILLPAPSSSSLLIHSIVWKSRAMNWILEPLNFRWPFAIKQHAIGLVLLGSTVLGWRIIKPFYRVGWHSSRVPPLPPLRIMICCHTVFSAWWRTLKDCKSGTSLWIVRWKGGLRGRRIIMCGSA